MSCGYRYNRIFVGDKRVNNFMLHKNRLFDHFEAWSEQSRDLVLATVIATTGSTYSKPGDFMLIADNGDFQGLLSGGCVEGDLAMHARGAIADNKARVIDYDLGGEHDELWGMGAGCEGSLHVLLTPLLCAQGYEQFSLLAQAYREQQFAMLILPLESGRMSVLLAENLDQSWRNVFAGRVFTRVPQAGHEHVAIPVLPAPSLLICGAGADANPLSVLAKAIGWRVVVADHRPHYIAQLGATNVDESRCAPASQITDYDKLNSIDAVIVMSHHLPSDIEYLRALAHHEFAYIGVLGPAHRRERILAAIGEEAGDLAQRLHGPAGFDIGGREPASIALSMLAQIHQACAKADRL